MLALRLGQPSVRRMLRRMSAREFLEWQIYASLEPFDEERADIRTADIVRALWNIARDTKKHPQPFTIEDFLLRFGEPVGKSGRKKQDVQTQIAMLTAIASAFRSPRSNKQGAPA